MREREWEFLGEPALGARHVPRLICHGAASRSHGCQESFAVFCSGLWNSAATGEVWHHATSFLFRVSLTLPCFGFTPEIVVWIYSWQIQWILNWKFFYKILKEELLVVFWIIFSSENSPNCAFALRYHQDNCQAAFSQAEKGLKWSAHPLFQSNTQGGL